MIRPGLLWFVAITCLAGAAAEAAKLGDNTVRLAPSQLKLPQNIGPLRFNGESRYSDRRLGRSYGYNASGISLSIYVYDYGLDRIPDGPDSPGLCEQYESAKDEIESGGNYENVLFRGEWNRPLADAPDSLRTREAVYEFDRHGVHAVSVLWFTAIDGHFLKLRLSLRAEVADELEEARAQILGALADAIDSRRKPVAVAAAPPPQEASIEIDTSHDRETGALWFTYAQELVKYSREHPQTRPACGGRLAAGYAAELAARRAALEVYRARASEQHADPYFDALLRIDAAGFLDEYSWYYLRNPRIDLAPQAELDLGDFEAFRIRELASHAVQSGARVRINSVRELPRVGVP